MTNTDKDPFIVKATAVTLVIMGALLICGIFIQHHNATRPTTHMTCKTVKAQHPEGDWTCVIWEHDPREADKYFAEPRKTSQNLTRTSQNKFFREQEK